MLIRLASNLGLLLVTTFYDNDYSDIDMFTLIDADGNVIFETNHYTRCYQFLLTAYNKRMNDYANS